MLWAYIAVLICLGPMLVAGTITVIKRRHDQARLLTYASALTVMVGTIVVLSINAFHWQDWKIFTGSVLGFLLTGYIAFFENPEYREQ